MKRVAVVGSRTFTDYKCLCDTLKVFVQPGDEIVSGGARGADSLAKRYADENKISTIIYYPEWDKYGKSAGFLRNEQIVKDCDILVAFWNQKSRGTKHSIDLARKAGKDVHIVIW